MPPACHNFHNSRALQFVVIAITDGTKESLTQVCRLVVVVVKPRCPCLPFPRTVCEMDAELGRSCGAAAVGEGSPRFYSPRYAESAHGVSCPRLAGWYRGRAMPRSSLLVTNQDYHFKGLRFLVRCAASVPSDWNARCTTYQESELLEVTVLICRRSSDQPRPRLASIPPTEAWTEHAVGFLPRRGECTRGGPPPTVATPPGQPNSASISRTIEMKESATECDVTVTTMTRQNL